MSKTTASHSDKAPEKTWLGRNMCDCRSVDECTHKFTDISQEEINQIIREDRSKLAQVAVSQPEPPDNLPGMSDREIQSRFGLIAVAAEAAPKFELWWRSNEFNLINYPKDYEDVKHIAEHAWQAAGATSSPELPRQTYQLPKYSWNPGSCCGDAHMELMTAKEHLKALGFAEERTESDSCVEILWRNVRAERAEYELEKLREEHKIDRP